MLPWQVVEGHRVRELVQGSRGVDAATWLHRTRPNERQLARFRQRDWPATAPKFLVVVRPTNNGPELLADSLRSLSGQTYPHWQAWVVIAPGVPAAVRAQVDCHAADGRVRALALDSLAGAPPVPTDCEFVCFLDHGDVLEPHALHRFAEAALERPADLIYSDEVVVGRSIDDILAIEVRPAFSYDYYLAREYFRNLTAVRRSVLARAGCFGEALIRERTFELVIRSLEHAQDVCHIPDVLYRRRRLPVSSALESSAAASAVRRHAVERHLQRMNWAARVLPTADPELNNVCFALAQELKVGIIIPTKNHGRLLRQCITSLEATIRPGRATILVLDHDSDDPETIAYLEELRGRWHVLPYRGPFNFSAMMNLGAAQLADVDYFLFLNNDTEAVAPGWLDHMLGLAQREEVGVVGALLLYPDRTVQHAGVVVGLNLAADHILRGEPACSHRAPGSPQTLLATRDQTAVTGACLLIRVTLFQALGGFNESLAVGFGDTDLCLRVGAAGYKVLLDSQAVLIHEESATRSVRRADPHPGDTHRFRSTHLATLLRGDPTYNPSWSYLNAFQLNGYMRCPESVRSRWSTVNLPRIGQVQRAAA